jgi:hypothetical protein
MSKPVSMIPWFPGEVEVPVNDYGSKFLPKKMIFLEIGLSMDDGNLSICYSYKGKRIAAPSAADLEKEVRKYLLRFPNRRRNKPRLLSGAETPMSINGEKSRLIMLKLSENNNLQFNQGGAPISVALGTKDNFGGVFKIDNEGNFISSGALMGEGPSPHCKHAIFAVQAVPEQAPPLSFNIHLDLVDYDDNGDINYKIPIIIDPDVRHPGGDNG